MEIYLQESTSSRITFTSKPDEKMDIFYRSMSPSRKNVTARGLPLTQQQPFLRDYLSKIRFDLHVFKFQPLIW